MTSMILSASGARSDAYGVLESATTLSFCLRKTHKQVTQEGEPENAVRVRGIEIGAQQTGQNITVSSYYDIQHINTSMKSLLKVLLGFNAISLIHLVRLKPMRFLG